MDVSNYGGSYLKASEADAESHFRIVAVDADTDYNGKPCLVLSLNGDKKWQLKPRDVNALRVLFGDDSDSWIGKDITLTKDQGDYQGTLYEFFVVNVYAGKAKAPVAKAPVAKAPVAKAPADPPVASFTDKADADDDDLPF